MTTEKIKELISQGKEIKFYKSKEWRTLRAKILTECHYECQECLNNGKISKAETVHHINELKYRPDLALKEIYFENGILKRNLIALCHSCHDQKHYRFGNYKPKPSINEERW